MSSPEMHRTYAQGYHVGYQHGLEAGHGGMLHGYPISLAAEYPERSSRLLMFFALLKPLLLLPHQFVLWFLSIGLYLVIIAAWFAVVILGKYPRPLWEFAFGVFRWQVRVRAWLLGLTDEYPPFSLK